MGYDMVMKYPNHLKELRKAKGLTAKDLSKLSGVKESTIKALDSGINNIAKSRASTLEALAKALHCKVKDLY